MPDLTPVLVWRESSLGEGGDGCVEVATDLPGIVAVRDSKDPFGPVLTFSPAVWRDFLKCVRDGDL